MMENRAGRWVKIAALWVLVGCGSEKSSDGDSAGAAGAPASGGTGGAGAESDGGAGGTNSGGSFSPPGQAGLEELELEAPPDDTVYIDPGNTADASQDGTLQHPYDSFDDVTITANTTYAVRRGTTLDINELILNADGVTILSYGSGERPILHSIVDPPEGENQHAIVSGWGGISDVTIRDVVVECPTATSCIRFGGSELNNQNLSIINVETIGGSWGIRAFGTTGLTIRNTEVSQTYDDGIFLQDNQGIEIAHCYVHDVNLNWQPPSTPEEEAGGDAIQLSRCNDWHVHHNALDRTNSGNKFCFISNNPDQNQGILEHNWMAGPLTVGGGASIYFHDGDGLVVRYNTILAPAATALYSHATNLEIYGNVVSGTDSAIYTSASSRVFNNTFYEVAEGVRGGTIEARNNIFVMLDSAPPFGNVTDLTQSNNLVVGADVPENSFTGDPDFEEPDANDFRLGTNSDAIDAGTDVDLTVDRAGTSLPQGEAFDVGAFEHSE